MLDKYGWDIEQMQELFNRVEYLSDSVAKKKVKVLDLKRVLLDECGIEIN